MKNMVALWPESPHFRRKQTEYRRIVIYYMYHFIV